MPGDRIPYPKYSQKNLKAFVKGRTGQIPKGNKKTPIAELRRLDANLIIEYNTWSNNTFHPIRLEIYRLLIASGHGGNLPRVNRAFRAEVEPLLYASAKVEISGEGVESRGKQLPIPPPEATAWLAKMMMRFPTAHLLRVQRLEIDVILQGDLEKLNWILYALVDVLADSTDLSRVEIDCVQGLLPPLWILDIGELLYPLTRLSACPSGPNILFLSPLPFDDDHGLVALSLMHQIRSGPPEVVPRRPVNSLLQHTFNAGEIDQKLSAAGMIDATFDCFLMAAEFAAEEASQPGYFDFDRDRKTCRAVRALEAMWLDKREEFQALEARADGRIVRRRRASI